VTSNLLVCTSLYTVITLRLIGSIVRRSIHLALAKSDSYGIPGLKAGRTPLCSHRTGCQEPRARPKAHLRRQMHGIFGRYVSIEQTDGRNNGTGVLRPATEVLIPGGTGPLVTRRTKWLHSSCFGIMCPTPTGRVRPRRVREGGAGRCRLRHYSAFCFDESISGSQSGVISHGSRKKPLLSWRVFTFQPIFQGDWLFAVKHFWRLGLSVLLLRVFPGTLLP